MKLTWVATLLLLSGADSVSAQVVQVEGIEIIERGIFDQTEVVEMRVLPPLALNTFSTVPIKANVFAEIKLLSNTSTIPARPGIRFGIRYLVLGSPGGASVNIKVIIRYPEEGVRNIKTGQIVYQSEAVQNKKIGALSYSGYGSEEDWEMTRGAWLIELWHQDRKLGEQAFTIVKPNMD